MGVVIEYLLHRLMISGFQVQSREIVKNAILIQRLEHLIWWDIDEPLLFLCQLVSEAEL